MRWEFRGAVGFRLVAVRQAATETWTTRIRKPLPVGPPNLHCLPQGRKGTRMEADCLGSSAPPPSDPPGSVCWPASICGHPPPSVSSAFPYSSGRRTSTGRRVTCLAVPSLTLRALILSQRARKHPVSRTSKDAQSLIAAADVANVWRDHETPGVSPKNSQALRALRRRSD